MRTNNLLSWCLAVFALVGTRAALAAPITFTGVVDNDFKATDVNVQVTPVLTNSTDVGPSPFMIQNGWVSGWAVNDVRTSYDASSDTLSVGFNTFKNAAGNHAIIGDADGNGNPGAASPQMSAAGGIDAPHLGGDKSVAIELASIDPKNPSQPGAPVLVAGVPADKTTNGPGLDGFNVATPKNASLGIGYDFGKTLTANLGALAFDPSAQHPGFEFTIKNFSKIPGLNPSQGFWISAYAGSAIDRVVGEAGLNFTRQKAVAEENIPEPTTILGWSLVAAGMAFRTLRKRTRS